MGRTRMIYELILQVLDNDLLRFTEIKRRIEDRFARKIADKVLSENIELLVKSKQLERILDKDGHIKYRKTNTYYKKEVVERLKGILSFVAENENVAFSSLLDTHEIPVLAFADMNSHEDIVSLSNFYREYDPIQLIAQRMIFELKRLPHEEERKVLKFLAWAYWSGLQTLNFVKVADQHEKVADSVIEQFREEASLGTKEACDRIEAEKKVLAILSIVKEACKKPNLEEFIRFIFTKKHEVEQLQDETWKRMEGRILGGEETFDELFGFHEIVLHGLESAIPKRNSEQQAFFATYHEVWNAFIQGLFLENDLSDVEGDVDKAKKMIKYYVEGLKVLSALPSKCKTVIVYVWGFDEILDLSKKGIIPIMEGWLSALRNRHLDHRSWLFTHETIKRVEHAYRLVKKGAIPPFEKIDLSESWTARDLYLYHPRAKNPDFWIQEILEPIKVIKELKFKD